MANVGWISIHRKIRDCVIWDTDEPFTKRDAWIDLLLLANHADKEIIFDGKKITVKKGQYLTSVRKLAQEWNWGNAKTLAYLRLLEECEMITRDANSSRTLITIVNYDFYQDKDINNRTLTDTVSERKPSTNNKDNNVNNNITSKDVICPTTSVERVIKAWNDLPVSIREVSRMTSTSTRYKSLMTRIKEYGEENVIKAVNRIRDSDYLLGNNKYDWVITFDWFVKPNNFPKVLDGNYDNKGIKKAIADDNKVSGIEPPHGGGAWQ